MKYDINLCHLEYFVKVSKLGSINKAAQALYICQSYLGEIIDDLVENLGVRLFNRSRSGVTLTPEGLDFLGHAKKILREMESIQYSHPASDDAAEPLSVSMSRFSHIMESFSEVDEGSPFI